MLIKNENSNICDTGGQRVSYGFHRVLNVLKVRVTFCLPTNNINMSRRKNEIR